MIETESMADKELDKAITNHLKKLDNMEVMGKFDRRIKNSGVISCKDSFLSNSTKHGDWNDSRSNIDDNINLTENPGEWKCKTLYSIPSTSHTSCSILYSKIYPESLNVEQKNLIFNLEVEKEKRENQKEKMQILHRIRNKLAYFQATQGMSYEEYSFAAFIKTMGQVTAKSLLALFYFIVNVIPLSLIFLFMLRFLLDKLIDIQQTKDRQQFAVKTLTLGLQLSFIYLCLTFIFGIIWMPTFQIVIKIMSSCIINPTY